MNRGRVLAACAAAWILTCAAGISAARAGMPRGAGTAPGAGPGMGPMEIPTAAPTETPSPTATEAPTGTPSPTSTEAPTGTPSPTEAPTAAPTGTPAPPPAPTGLPDYLAIEAGLENSDGVVRLSYRVDLGPYDFAGVPVNVYLAAVARPVFSAGDRLGVDEIFQGGEVHVFTPQLRTYISRGIVHGPTFRDAVFPAVPAEGEILIDAVQAGIYRESYAFAALFARSDTGGFVRTDGAPAAGSGVFTPYSRHVIVLARTIHVGDAYDPYMATWEVSRPMGTAIDVSFEMERVPEGSAVLRAAVWGTYYDDPVYLNGAPLGILPRMANRNYWLWSAVRVPSWRFVAGTNVMTFGDDVNPSDGHWDNYMAKGWEIHYN